MVHVWTADCGFKPLSSGLNLGHAAAAVVVGDGGGSQEFLLSFRNSLSSEYSTVADLILLHL